MIYLDNSATTAVLNHAARVTHQTMTESFFNPSSIYAPAVAVECKISAVRANLAQALHASSEEIIFTSGGTESNNIAILGCAAANRGPRRYITTVMEHPAVYDVFRALELSGQDVVYLEVDRMGRVNMQMLDEYLDEQTALVSIMHVNNEVGSVANLNDLYAHIKRRSPSTLVHSDGVQAFTKLPFHSISADLYTLSGHKFHAPKGVGALLVRKGVRNNGGNIGGGHERGMRSGTLNAPGILGMGAAMGELAPNQAANETHMRLCKQSLYKNLSTIQDCFVNGPGVDEGAAHILNMSFMGVRGEVLLHSLEQKGIYVSTGSACASNKRAPTNRVLDSLGVVGERQAGAVRFSLCPFNTRAQIDIAAQAIVDSVRDLRRVCRK